MLITPRTYSASQTPDQGATFSRSETSSFFTLAGWRRSPVDEGQAADMLLIHQVGSVRVGEIVRYTVTYTPAADPILPIPSELYVRVKNTSAIPLRAAYLHGPYTLYTACYPSKFDPNHKYDQPDLEGSPQFEPYLKAGGNWDATIKVPTHLQLSQNLGPSGRFASENNPSVTWVIEIVSQVIFSSSAAVHFELLVGRDIKSLGGFSVGGAWSSSSGPPGKLHDHWIPETKGRQALATKGVYSGSVTLRVDDTNSLWNSPPLPSADRDIKNGISDMDNSSHPWDDNEEPESAAEAPLKHPRKKKVHLVLLTHGLHSNLGADMLYLKESIDTAAKEYKRQTCKAKTSPKDSSKSGPQDPVSSSCVNRISNDICGPVSSDSNNGKDDAVDEANDEQVIVRGFSGNAVRTERGIQYLGKRLAKYVLLMTYPDQPYFPLKGSKERPFSRPFTARKEPTQTPGASQLASETSDDPIDLDGQAYQITSISFIGHSLGGLIQTYAIAYIQKYSPEFFERIKPINFIALATPFLGLSNENPMYVRFALDLGLVGRTGQDLGLSWTAPKVRSGWGALIGGRGESAKDQGQGDPGSKPLLRILPCGPAHEVLHKFQHRTIYSNVVNDGIVPLRTSCLLFLDWRGLERVEKARRDNGLVGTMAEWGWAELTGANSNSPRIARLDEEPLGHNTEETAIRQGLPKISHGAQAHSQGHLQGHQGVDLGDTSSPPASAQFLARPGSSPDNSVAGDTVSNGTSENTALGPLDSFLSLFRPKETKPPTGKHTKIYKRSQTLGSLEVGEHPRPPVRGNSLNEHDGLYTPPKTTFFESAGDLLMPPLPPTGFILDPASRPRTIFHDRIYHPGDVPPPLPIKRRTLAFGPLQNKNAKAAPTSGTQLPPGSSAMADNCESGLKVEEKIARAYHRDLSWRKVLVRLEPDAHNNIIVRRMFTNAHGWPVIKHLIDTHFGHAPSVEVDDSLKQSVERAKSPNIGPTSSGDEVESRSHTPGRDLHPPNDPSQDHLPGTTGPHLAENPSSGHPTRRDRFPAEDQSHKTTGTYDRVNYAGVSRQDSARWSDREVDEDDDCDSEFEEEGFRWSPRPMP
ncbi:hypothetical protein NUU61_003682 [Penicillium alfredii]|uniref:DUF676 domain-containing protein n=1 Tax=Penicillium alfredii TaxID=1506179 RepID=A0A9W9KCK7_9EURO|nr:uncharacterized protein NUU61_003682 [Penicillium alfredii]KAJ5101460.1 hypothetical protein NUU61_003682 [Penicillium alfredii]